MASRALDGVRYVLACQVVFNHVGLQEGGVGGSWGAAGQARFFCIHVPTFFALAGFSLAINMAPPTQSYITFVGTRLNLLYPSYLFSLSLLLINLLLQCHPAVFDPAFHYTAQPDDARRGDFCEPAPLLSTYWGSLSSTIVIYALSLQSWPIYLHSWFLSYYAWFSSVYFALLATHPFFYTALCRLRGRKALLFGV